jgi:hypothetical protein
LRGKGALVIVELRRGIDRRSRLSVARGVVKERIKLTSVESEALEVKKPRGLHRPPGRHGLWVGLGEGESEDEVEDGRW